MEMLQKAFVRLVTGAIASLLILGALLLALDAVFWLARQLEGAEGMSSIEFAYLSSSADFRQGMLFGAYVVIFLAMQFAFQVRGFP